MMQLRYLLSPLIAAVVLLGGASAQIIPPPGAPPGWDGPAELPRRSVDVSVPAVTGATTNLHSGGNLQAALNNAAPGDEIVLAAGGTFTCSPCTLPNKSGSGWITVRSSESADLPAAGTRITPADARKMARVQSAGNGTRVLETATSAHHYYFLGIEFTHGPDSATATDILRLGSGSNRVAANTAHHIVIARSYIHGSDHESRKGIAAHVDYFGLVDSEVSGVFVTDATSQDCQALFGANFGGPWLIENNKLEALTETVMIGGADPKVTGMVPSDLTFRKNDITKNPEWIGVHSWVKNLFELKLGVRVLIEANVLHGTWNAPQDQRGQVFNLKSENQDRTAPWSETSNVTIRYNKAYDANSWITVAARGGRNPVVALHNLSIHDNLAYDIGKFGGNDEGIIYQLGTLPDDGVALVGIDIRNNTVVANSTAGQYSVGLKIVGTGATYSNELAFENNITPVMKAGVKADGFSAGTASIQAQWLTNYTMAGNVLVGSYRARDYPAGNTRAANIAAVGFTNPGGDDYSLTSSSFALTAGVGGARAGADIPTVLAHTSGVVSSGR